MTMMINDFFDFGNELRGKCETNYFHMYVYSDINSDKITELDNVKKGTFMHEYLHYVQFVNTIFGLSYGIIYNNYFSYCREYFSKHNNYFNQNYEYNIEMTQILSRQTLFKH